MFVRLSTPCFFLLPLLFAVSDAGMVSVCGDMKDCASCTDSYIHFFSFKEFCRWCVPTRKCGLAVSCPPGQATAQRDSFKCPVSAPNVKGHRYTDQLGRSLYSLAIASKADDPVPCLKNSRPDVTLIERYEVECDQSGGTCAGMLAVSNDAKAIYVVYRGSTFDKQLFREFVQGIGAQLGAWEKFVNGTGVMTYFHGGFKSLFLDGGMRDKLIELLKKHEGYRIWVTGHSLGGSLASMTALYITTMDDVNPDRVRLITFGEPRTGNYLFAKTIEETLKFRFRVVNRNDMVTNIPAPLDPDNVFLSVADSKRQPHYYRFLIHYENGMSRKAAFKTCELAEDAHCRNLAAAIDMNDHVTYFGIKADDYLKSECKRELLL